MIWQNTRTPLAECPHEANDLRQPANTSRPRKEVFLIELNRVVSWKGLIALIEPYYSKDEDGRPTYPLIAMLRVYLLQ